MFLSSWFNCKLFIFKIPTTFWLSLGQKPDSGGWSKPHEEPDGNKSPSDQAAWLWRLQRAMLESNHKLLFSASRSNRRQHTMWENRQPHEACCGCLHMGTHLKTSLARQSAQGLNQDQNTGGICASVVRWWREKWGNGRKAGSASLLRAATHYVSKTLDRIWD